MSSVVATFAAAQDTASREAGACTAHMVDKIRTTERHMQFSFSSDLPYVAAAYMDKFLHCTDMIPEKYQLIALACLILAAKYEEAEEAVPPLKDLKKYCDIDGREPNIDKIEVNRMEGVVFAGDSMMGKPLVPEVPAYLQRYSDFFAELVCQQADFQCYLPTLSAAAIVVATRRAVNLLPNWTPELEQVLGYTAQQVQGPFLHLWLHYADAFPQQTAVTDAQFKDTVAAAVQTYRGVPPAKAVMHLQSQPSAAQGVAHGPSMHTAPGKVAADSRAHQVTPNAKLSLSQRSDVSVATSGSSLTPGGRRGFGELDMPSMGAGLGSVAPSFVDTAGAGNGNPYLSSGRVGASAGSSGLQTQRPALGSQPINIQQTAYSTRSKGFGQGASGGTGLSSLAGGSMY